MTHCTIPTGLEHLSEQELRSLYARIYANLVGNAHSAEDQELMILALQRIKTMLLRKSCVLRP